MSYSWEQTVFSLCMAANAVADIKACKKETGDTTELTDYMSIALKGGDLANASQDGAFRNWNGGYWKGFFPEQNVILDGGDWTVVWGPSVYVEHAAGTIHPLGGLATNSMYVAYSKARAAYVVAIAGTNPANISDWKEEDLNVDEHTTSTWPPEMPFTPKDHKPYPNSDALVSGSTAFGISNLLCQIKDKATGKSIKEFLDAVANKNDKIVFTGHSLGGALAPSLAFYLYPSKETPWSSVEIYPYAGATPGNQTWLDAFRATYPDVMDHMNIHDVVPHGWNQIDQIISDRKTALTDNGDGIAKGEEYYDSIFGVIKASSLTNPGVGEEMHDMVAYFKNRPNGVDYANIPHDKHGSVDFSSNWGTFSWNHPVGPIGYVVNVDPQWIEWPEFTLGNPLTNDNPPGASGSLSQLGNLIYATHIHQYFKFMGVTPVQLLPGVKKEAKHDEPVA